MIYIIYYLIKSLNTFIKNNRFDHYNHRGRKMNQSEAFRTFSNDIIFYGELYVKYGLVLAVIAKGGEFIETWTADGLETTNTAKAGDYIVKNLQTEWQEIYIVPADVFNKRYVFFYSTENGSVYKPTGKVLATIYYGNDRHFIAPWGTPMQLRTGDFLVTSYPECNGIYRIAAKEFYETYKRLQF